ncbi:gp239 [Sphingomonas phage PAU]|uniref:DNA helicase n=1 Tax=Sphingomonas phage PAU TaxID=1150991 RepID=UPI00025733F5|nr:DNA helicase [Sphingomonas phage PAU]AFF28237.1 gp239 [Sphingomonas phage PAU]
MNDKDFIDDLDALLSPKPENVSTETEETKELVEKRSRILECLDKVIDKLCENPGILRERIEQTQKPIIEKALNAYIKGVKNYIVEAPTGAGKSIIGLLINESIYLYNNKDIAAYTLTPTKILQDQLDEDNKRLNLGWALLKGQGNYMCLENNENFTKRACHKLAISKAAQLPCAETCEYIQKRKAAILSHNAVLSYAYWLSAMNYMYNMLGDNSPFQPREVTVFDECHMLADTVQSMFQVEISNQVQDRIVKLISFYESVEKDVYKLERMFGLTKDFKKCFDHLFKITNEQSLKDVYDTMLMTTAYIHRISNMFLDFIQEYFPKNTNLWSVGQQEFDKNFERFASVSSNMKFFLSNNKDIENIVADKTVLDDGTVVLLFRTLNESSLMARHVHKYTQFAVWTSATLGGRKGLESWAEQNGITNYEYTIMESNFDFENCPINICSPTISMSFKDKANNMNALMMRIMTLINCHEDERGIIHTGNFEIARNLKTRTEKGNDRFIFYNNSFEKAHAIEELKRSKNGIIVGPSLSEGLDLKDDLARFAILAKVPYPSLADSLNKLKLERIPGWYDWQTVVTVQQQLGRHVRHKTDWGTTYMLDSGFERVITNSTFPNYIANRFTKINVNKLVTDFQNQDSDFDDLY